MQKITGLVCPSCHGALKPEGERAVRCGTCGAAYPVIAGIPSFVNKSVEPQTLPGCALTVIIPALNEAANLDSLLPEVQRALKALEPLHEVIVVDGGSTDGTQETVRKHGARLATQSLPGFGGALRAGFDQARGEYVLTLDADGSHDASFIRDLWAARESGEVVIASRYVKGGSAEMPAWRFFLSRLLNITFRRGLSLPVSDLSSGYRLYSRTALQETQLLATDFDILEEILIRVLAAGYRVHEVPFQYKARRSGKSHARLIKFGISYSRTFAAMWRLRNSVASADYDSRAFDSVVPLQRYWQRHRHKIVGRLSKGFGRILDVGCGSSRILASNPAIVGLDIQLHKLRYARQFGNQLVHGSIFELPFPNDSFDCVICSEVVEHIPAEEKPFDELFRVLRSGGRLILGTPDYDRWLWRALEWLYKRVSPGGYADEHITQYSRRNLTEYLKGKGFAVERVDYVGGSEMIFCLRKLGPMESSVPARSIQSALRDVSAA